MGFNSAMKILEESSFFESYMVAKIPLVPKNDLLCQNYCFAQGVVIVKSRRVPFIYPCQMFSFFISMYEFSAWIQSVNRITYNQEQRMKFKAKEGEEFYEEEQCY